MVLQQQMLERREKEKNGTVTKGSDEIKVMYTNIYGIIARKLSRQNIYRRKNPELYA